MLYILATYMRQPANARVAACCAHQRIMTFLDQANPDPKDVSAEPAFAGMLRQVQAFDFESGLAVFNGIHALLGFLPVRAPPRVPSLTVPRDRLRLLSPASTGHPRAVWISAPLRSVGRNTRRGPTHSQQPHGAGLAHPRQPEGA